MQPNHRIASDIGGTFTDIAYIAADGSPRTKKVPSTPDDYGVGVVDGVRQLSTDCGLGFESLSDLLHGCTVATNAILEQKGARTALITTKGFGDILEMRRIRTPRLYAPLYVKPPPLVPRRLRFEVEERCTYRGEVITPVNVKDVEAAIGEIRDARIEAVAVAFLHAYANPENEHLVGAMLRESFPGMFITLSSEVAPEIREYERTSTTVINAYVGPPVEAYLSSLMRQLEGLGFGGRFQVMQSSGGILDAKRVLKKPCEIIECGPAAGVIACRHIGQLAGYANIISLDMGGTTAKASIIEGGRLSMADEYEVGGGISLSSRLVQGGGYSLKTPAIDIAEVGAGGGSVVWLDKAGSLKVGPQSAGSVPGPVCFGKGGDRPTITDANLVLGYISPDTFADGAMRLNAAAARTAIEDGIAKCLRRDLLEIAYGIHVVANASMLRAIKAVSVYRGRNPKDFVMFAFGGNGPIHAADLARTLRMKEVVVPRAAGVFSAMGLLFADVSFAHSRALLCRTSRLPLSDINQAYRDLEGEVISHLGRPPEQVVVQRAADIRYVSQAHEIRVPLPSGVIDDAAILGLETRFLEEHEGTYGYRFPAGHQMEIVTLRVVGSVPPGQAADLAGNAWSTPPVARTGKPAHGRRAYFGPAFGEVDTPVLARTDLSHAPIAGPLLVDESDTTIVIPPYAQALLDDCGNVVVRVSTPDLE